MAGFFRRFSPWGTGVINSPTRLLVFSLKNSVISSTIDLLGLTVKVTNSSGSGYVYVPKVISQDANETNHQAFLDLSCHPMRKITFN